MLQPGGAYHAKFADLHVHEARERRMGIVQLWKAASRITTLV